MNTEDNITEIDVDDMIIDTGATLQKEKKHNLFFLGFVIIMIVASSIATALAGLDSGKPALTFVEFSILCIYLDLLKSVIVRIIRINSIYLRFQKLVDRYYGR